MATAPLRIWNAQKRVDVCAALFPRRSRRVPRHAMGTLGSGNHYLELQCVDTIYDPETAAAFGLDLDDVLVSIHYGSRGLGHQIGTEFLKKMAVSAAYGTIPARVGISETGVFSSQAPMRRTVAPYCLAAGAAVTPWSRMLSATVTMVTVVIVSAVTATVPTEPRRPA